MVTAMIEVSFGVLATAGLFVGFGLGFGVHRRHRARPGEPECASCTGGCGATGCSGFDREEGA